MLNIFNSRYSIKCTLKNDTQRIVKYVILWSVFVIHNIVMKSICNCLSSKCEALAEDGMCGSEKLNNLLILDWMYTIVH